MRGEDQVRMRGEDNLHHSRWSAVLLDIFQIGEHLDDRARIAGHADTRTITVSVPADVPAPGKVYVIPNPSIAPCFGVFGEI